MKILLTGIAGFIGFHLTKKLIENNYEIYGLDSINNYYDPTLKIARLYELGFESSKIKYNTEIISNKYSKLKFIKLNLEDINNFFNLFKNEKFDLICHLAAQAGVRYSLIEPYSYINSNILGFLNILEACRKFNISNLIYASSSSVYGLNEKIPFSIFDKTDQPISLYGVTKKSNELMAYSYSYLFNIKTIGLRFFTVYGPYGRPDMALFKFTKSILENKPIQIFNFGNMSRDFTYIDDVVEGIIKIINKLINTLNNNKNESGNLNLLYKIYNIGNGQPIKLLDFVEAIEKVLGKKAIKEFLPLQPGDVQSTWADLTELENDFSYKPKTNINDGVKKFVDWYISYYKVKI